MTEADVSARLAWPDDADAIAALQAAAWEQAYGVASDEPMDARWRTMISAPPDARVRVLVACEGPTVRGYALVHPCHDQDADQVADGEIGELVIEAAYRRQGHGSRLMQACIDTMAADTFTRAVWWLDSTDDARRGFAVSAGWAADGSHRELEAESGQRIKQVRLHTATG
jgi:ribosomal protein S18 acetylase RimI-like enzyme